MSESPAQSSRESAKPCPPTEAPSTPSLPTASTITSFQILPTEPSPPQPHSPHAIDFATLLTHKIDPLHRLKLLKWLLSEAVSQSYYREVFAYAAHYLDRFLALSERVDLGELQVLAFGALLLATKIEGAAFPRLGKVFDTNQILAAEARIGLRLNYFLSPRTYVHVLTDLIAEWDRFADGEKLYEGQRYLAQSLGGFQRHRAVYERMECVYMAPQSHKFPVSGLALNLFFLMTKINIKEFAIGLNASDSLLNFIRDSYVKLDSFGFTFQQFLQVFGEDDGRLDLQVGLYLASFICLPVGLDTPNRKCINYQSYLRMQTVTEESIAGLTKLAKSRRERQ